MNGADDYFKSVSETEPIEIDPADSWVSALKTALHFFVILAAVILSMIVIVW